MSSESIFVITPIGKPDSPERRRADDLFDLVIAPVLEEVNAGRGEAFLAERADKQERPGSITETIVRLIIGSRFVIVDATGRNANVFYEMGIADAFGIPTIRITDDLEDLPFDSADHSVIELPAGIDGHLLGRDVDKAKGRLRSQILEVLSAEFSVSSIVTKFGRTADIRSFTTSLGEGDEQSKAMAVILEKLGGLDEKVTRLRVSQQTASLADAVGEPLGRKSVRAYLDEELDHNPDYPFRSEAFALFGEFAKWRRENGQYSASDLGEICSRLGIDGLIMGDLLEEMQRGARGPAWGRLATLAAHEFITAATSNAIAEFGEQVGDDQSEFG